VSLTATGSPHSIGCATDVMHAAFDGDVVDRGDYWVLRTPTNPHYSWGNYLLFRGPPTEENAMPDGERSWERIFDAELGAPGHGGRLLAWDRVDGDYGAADAFVARGYAKDDSYALIASRLVPPGTLRSDIEVRPVRGDHEWQIAEALCTESFSEHARGNVEGQRAFVALQFRRYRRMTDAGMGTYFGAFSGAEMAGAAGVFGKDGLFRYQLVATRPAYRRKGVCATLVYGAGGHALSHFGAETLVILAAANYHAWRVYQSVGLEPTERLPALRLRAR
jgi:hypothetical protein